MVRQMMSPTFPTTISVPFEDRLRSLSSDREGKKFLPLPIGQIEVMLDIWHDIFWELGMDRNNSCQDRVGTQVTVVQG